MQCAENDDELREIFTGDEALDLLYSTGYTKPTQNITLTDRDDLLNVLLDFHLMARVKMEMDQFKVGLSTFGFIDQIKKNPAIWRPYFVPSSNKLSAG